MRAAETVTWIKVPKPTFDLVGVVLSSFGLAGILAGTAFVLGVLLGVSIILWRKRHPRHVVEGTSLHLAPLPREL